MSRKGAGVETTCQCVWQTLVLLDGEDILLIFPSFISLLRASGRSNSFRVNSSFICWPVLTTFLYYIVIRLVIFSSFMRFNESSFSSFSSFFDICIQHRNPLRDLFVCSHVSEINRRWIKIKKRRLTMETASDWLIFHLIWVLCVFDLLDSPLSHF